jgi:hypothetical protein
MWTTAIVLHNFISVKGEEILGLSGNGVGGDGPSLV